MLVDKYESIVTLHFNFWCLVLVICITSTVLCVIEDSIDVGAGRDDSSLNRWHKLEHIDKGRSSINIYNSSEILTLWPPDVKSSLIWKDPDIGKGWRKDKGTVEDEMVGWTQGWVNSRSWWWTGRPGVLRSMGSQRVGHDSDWTQLNGSDGEESVSNTGDLALIPGLGRFLEKGIATHSSVLAWRIAWTEEPGALQSVRLQRVGHDWATGSFSFTTCEIRANQLFMLLTRLLVV